MKLSSKERYIFVEWLEELLLVCRHPQNNQPAASTSLPGDLFSNDQAVKTPPPPPGLQNSAPSQSFYNPSRTPRSLTQQGQGQFGPQVNISFSAPPQIQNQQLQNQQFPRPQNHLPFPGVFQEPGPNQFRDGPPPGKMPFSQYLVSLLPDSSLVYIPCSAGIWLDYSNLTIEQDSLTVSMRSLSTYSFEVLSSKISVAWEQL